MRKAQRTAYAEVPPRVEYTLTHFGAKFLLDSVATLQSEIDEQASSDAG